MTSKSKVIIQLSSFTVYPPRVLVSWTLSVSTLCDSKKVLFLSRSSHCVLVTSAKKVVLLLRLVGRSVGLSVSRYVSSITKNVMDELS